MNRIREYKIRLQVNYTYLIDTLEVDPVMDLCFEKSVLTFTDMERLRAERSRPDRVKLFIGILKSKSEAKSYEVFLETLTNDRVQQPFIKKRLDESTVVEQYKEGNSNTCICFLYASVSVCPPVCLCLVCVYIYI